MPTRIENTAVFGGNSSKVISGKELNRWVNNPTVNLTDLDPKKMYYTTAMVYTLSGSINFTVTNGATVPFKTSNNEAVHGSNIIVCSALFYPSSDGKATISVNITGQNTSIRVFELEQE